ncbi:MAG: RDD family protein [Candidatus Nanopelagicales bacterium]|nr:RDD family protein [Candidatus Nanopelagicales bacterium]
MPQALGNVTLGPDGQVLSGWWRRFFGYFIDMIVIAIATVVVVIVVGTATGAFGSLFDEDQFNEFFQRIQEDPGWTPTLGDMGSLFGPGFVTLVLTELAVSFALSAFNGVLLVAWTGQTVGDRAVKNRKVTAGRQLPGMGAAFVRWVIPAILGLVQMIQVIGLLAFLVWVLDYLWPLGDRMNQTLHDKAAHTYVERSDLAPPVAR